MAKRLLRVLRGQDLFVPVQVRLDKLVLGGEYAQWCVSPLNLSSDSVVYSFGIGTDISFDLELIQRFGVRVHAFDPTPRSIAWLTTQRLPQEFMFHDYGVAGHDGSAFFQPPQDPHRVSYSVVAKVRPAGATVAAPVQRLSTITKMLGHENIDLLKMDIEGAEYAVIEDLMASAVPVGQLLVEFHHRWAEVGIRKTREAIQSLNRAGYRVFDVSPSGDEYSFWRTDPPALASGSTTGAACDRHATLDPNSSRRKAAGADG